MKSLKESLLDSSLDTDDLGVEYPQVKYPLLVDRLNRKYRIDRVALKEFVDKMNSFLDDSIINGDDHIRRVSKLLMDKMMVEIRSTPLPDNKELDALKSLKRPFEEIDSVFTKCDKQMECANTLEISYGSIGISAAPNSIKDLYFIAEKLDKLSCIKDVTIEGGDYKLFADGYAGEGKKQCWLEATFVPKYAKYIK